MIIMLLLIIAGICVALFSRIRVLLVLSIVVLIAQVARAIFVDIQVLPTFILLIGYLLALQGGFLIGSYFSEGGRISKPLK